MFRIRRLTFYDKLTSFILKFLRTFLFIQGVFKKNGEMHNGTVNLCGQIVMNTLIDEKINNEYDSYSDLLFKNHLLKDLLNHLVDSRYRKKFTNQLHKSSRVKLNEMEQNHKYLIFNYQCNFSRLEYVEQSYLAWFNQKSKNNFMLFFLYITI